MAIKKGTLRQTQRKAEQTAGFRIDHLGSMKVLSDAETEDLVWRAIYDSMAASFRVERAGH